MPEWWSIINTILGGAILVFGWLWRTSWQDREERLDAAVSKLDRFLELHSALERELVKLRGEVDTHDRLDEEKFRNQIAWNERQDRRMDAQDERERNRRGSIGGAGLV